ncbi:MAG: hypothetical protein AB1472_00195 [Candidatus Omnitrophota bacterium]
MNKRVIFLLLFVLFFDFNNLSWADKERQNFEYKKYSEYGKCSAKCIPTNSYGQEGETSIYRVYPENKTEQLMSTYNWYSQEIYLLDDCATVVRFGPWPQGSKATKEDLAIAFYNGGLLIKEYSTLDIAGKEDNVERTVSHYNILKKVLGFRIVGGDDAIFDNEYIVFDVETIDGRKLSFNVENGKIIIH